MQIDVKVKPVLDPGFVPAVLWNRAYQARCTEDAGSKPLGIALSQPDGTVYTHSTTVLPHEGANIALNDKYVERLVKFLLWGKGGNRITVAGNRPIAGMLAEVYSPAGARRFDFDVMGHRMFRETMTVTACPFEELPAPHETHVSLGRHLDGCRIGFDLGGSDRKAAAVIDGEVVFSEEIEWHPYFESDPTYHLDGIRASLKRAAAHLPRVDAIGGSAAGCYVNNEPRIASLFRGLSESDFDRHARTIFHRLKEEWHSIPFDIANDGEVTALAGSMSLNANAVLGIAMGTSQAVGYCDPSGCITSGLNELAFAPVDYRPNAPVDEWSGDVGCGVQYFSQQAVVRLAPEAGITLPANMPFPEQLIAVQELMEQNDPRALRIYQTVGTYFGYALATYADFYTIRHLLLLGRVTSGTGGQVIIATAEQVLRTEFPELSAHIRISTPDENLKRHGQAIAAASLPSIEPENYE